MKRWFLSLLLLANCAPFGEATPDTTNDQAATAPAKKEATTATSTATSSASSSDGTTSSAAPSTFTETQLWPVSNNKVVIPVCWDPTFPPLLREDIVQMTRAQWNLQSPLSFTGFGSCSGDDLTSVRLLPTKGSSTASGIGMMPGIQVLLATDSATLIADALHELGHVAGLGHEGFDATTDFERSQCSEFEVAMKIVSDLPIDAPVERAVLDPDNSIMSRCHAPSPGISEADNAAIAKIYGVPAVDWSSIEPDDN